MFAVTVIAAVFGVRVGGSGFWSGSDFLTVEMGIVGAAVFMGSLRFSISSAGWGRVRFVDFPRFVVVVAVEAGHDFLDEIHVVR